MYILILIVKGVDHMDSILQQIYAGGLAPICDAMPRVREYQEALQAHFRHYDALREKLTRLDPALQREFDRFADEQLDLRPMDLEEQFLMGFRLGARLMIEVLDQPET